MSRTLAGKTAFITGATGAIASATLLASDGARLVLMGRREGALRETAAQIRQALPDADVHLQCGDGCENDKSHG
jgi:NADP-dependent 3-hydroxy acid dehydrogenase YdfG